MTHDPFCTRSEVPYDPWRPCYCDVIAKVRADTLKRVEAQITLCYLLAMRDYKRTNGAFNQGEIQAYETCQEIIDSLRGES